VTDDDRLRIGIDFDGTLADSIGAAAQFLEEFDGIVLEAHERRWPPGRLRLGAERFNSMIEDDRFFERLDFVPGAEAAVRALLGRADVFLVTARTEAQTEPVRRWLETRDLSLSGFASTSYEQKTEACRALALDVHFDDMIAHTQDLSRETGTVLALLAAPWNDLVPTEGVLPDGEPRIHEDWSAFQHWVEQTFDDRLASA
jgi:uncharacterized HAD superfamily protein